MAIHQQQHNQSFSLDDALYCEEEEDQWKEEDEDNDDPCVFNPLVLSEQDLFWEDEELVSLFSKEQQFQQIHLNVDTIDRDSVLALFRREAVEWILKVNTHYGFTALTAILAINYLDRFISLIHFQREKPWMIQLAAVTCLSLAAKVEETQVPLLLDLQVEGSKYVFEAKTIQRMELMVLSALEWRMNPVTPISFLDHIIRRLGLKTHLHWKFLQQCESLIISLVSDSRSVGYLPSVLATATMLHVINHIEPCNFLDYQNQLLGVLKISMEKVNDCYKLIEDAKINPLKRKYHHELTEPVSPNGVVDSYFGSSSDSSNESWKVGSSVSSSSPTEPVLKKRRGQELQISLPSFSRFFMDAVASPH